MTGGPVSVRGKVSDLINDYFELLMLSYRTPQGLPTLHSTTHCHGHRGRVKVGPTDLTDHGPEISVTANT